MPRAMATCHPDRPAHALELCRPCYDYSRKHNGKLPPSAQDSLEEAQARAAQLSADLAEAQQRLGAYESAGRPPGTVRVPEWAVPGPTSRAMTATHHATPTLLLTDLHFGEVVRREEIMGYNEYNSAVATKRLKYTIDRTAVMVRRYMSGIEIDGIVVAFGGDFISGNIHDELAETNDENPSEVAVRMAPLLAAGLKALADEFGHVYCPAVVGNHDRMSQKKKAKRKAQDSWTWVIYNWVKQLVSDDPRIEIDIAEGPDIIYNIYDTTYLLTHGDQFHGGSGIAGALSPLSLGAYRKHRRNDNLGIPFDYMVMGHFHQTLYLPNVIVGGSMKGLDEYAFQLNVVPEVPRQSLWLTTPERGITIRTHVDCDPRTKGRP